MTRIAPIVTAAVASVALMFPGAADAQAPDVTGQWELTRQGGPGGGGRGRGGGGGRGAGGPSELMLVQEGQTITGSLQMRGQPVDIQDGVVDGNAISFRVVLDFNGRSIEMSYSGTIDGNMMSGTMVGGPRGRESQWSATRVET